MFSLLGLLMTSVVNLTSRGPLVNEKNIHGFNIYIPPCIFKDISINPSAQPCIPFDFHKQYEDIS